MNSVKRFGEPVTSLATCASVNSRRVDANHGWPPFAIFVVRGKINRHGKRHAIPRACN